ncbi:MAG: cyclic pyranopterin monophosphate synthase MoaC [Deltaproteobacteria bacterium]|jgi:cyclic pyranopterin phosphate synthase|nr:cyclic pyranopterin monophosphate synthase MoaC [Deltaproteobacteria bacterium]
MAEEFSHIRKDGSVAMVDVGRKQESVRVAVAGAVVEMSAATLDLLKRAALPKGDVLTTAKIAGIMAAKRTSELIPMCHPVALDYVDIRFEIHDAPPLVRLEAETRSTGRTGVEMEAIIAAQVAAAAIYDMCKAAQKDIRITNVRLLRKSGGRSGEYRAP